jgi:hypothetical protein
VFVPTAVAQAGNSEQEQRGDRMMKRPNFFLVLLACLTLAACGTTKGSRSGRGAAMGAAGGALIGSLSANAGKGAPIGAGAGARGGYL